MPHFTYSLLLAVLLAVVMGLLGNRPLRERFHVAANFFILCAGAIVIGSWTMYLIHG